MDGWSANQRMAKEVGYALVAVCCSRDVRFFVAIGVNGRIWALGVEISSVIRSS